MRLPRAFQAKHGSVLLKVAIMGFVLVLIGMGLISISQRAARSQGKSMSKGRFADLANMIYVISNDVSFCPEGTFRDADSNPLVLNATNVNDVQNVPEIRVGNEPFLKNGQVNMGIRIESMQFKTAEVLTSKSYLVDLTIKGAPAGGGPGYSRSFRLELKINNTTSKRIIGCLDRETYLESGLVMRSGYALSNVGCNASTVTRISDMSGSPGSWRHAINAHVNGNSTDVYRQEPDSTTTPATTRIAVLALMSCSPILGGGTCGSYSGPYDNPGSFPSTGSAEMQNMSYLPEESYKVPSNCNQCPALASGDPVPPLCNCYWSIGMRPYSQVVVSSTDHPFLGTPEWNKHMPQRHSSAGPIDLIDHSNPPLLAAAEKRCWVEVIDRPSNESSDSIFYVDPNSYSLSVGCRTTGESPWTLLGCFRSTDTTRPGSADNDLDTGEVPGVAKMCSTGDILQPHAGGPWATTKINVTAICGRIKSP
jgi:hypothetical protein